MPANIRSIFLVLKIVFSVDILLTTSTVKTEDKNKSQVRFWFVNKSFYDVTNLKNHSRAVMYIFKDSSENTSLMFSL